MKPVEVIDIDLELQRQKGAFFFHMRLIQACDGSEKSTDQKKMLLQLPKKTRYCFLFPWCCIIPLGLGQKAKCQR